MKKSNFYPVIAILLFTCSFSYGQIKVDTDGDVTIGATTAATEDLDVIGDTYFNGSVGIGGSPSATHELKVTGDVSVTGNIGSGTSSISMLTFNNFISGSGVSNFKTDWANYGVNLIPVSNNSIYLGYSDKAFKEIHCYSLTEHSADLREKENIKTLQGALSTITNLRGIQYDLKPEVVASTERRALINNEAFINKEIEKAKNQIGFIAQEVIEVLPNVVNYNDTTDTYSISYTRVIPVLVEAMKEQQVLIENLQSEISSLKSSSLKSLSTATNEENFSTTECTLFQNSPNPFGENTHIGYNLPDLYSTAKIVIYDMTGKQLRDIQLHDSGESSIEINAYEMDPGMYLYSMIVDNQLIDTKQMIITN